mmetsp:Transcript_27874/g.65794  ORF Transcript_27874/g.65794 Transcript_27874/m.65794 type:complete len:151 (-) Transcript_27874:1352-1804(-)
MIERESYACSFQLSISDRSCRREQALVSSSSHSGQGWENCARGSIKAASAAEDTAPPQVPATKGGVSTGLAALCCMSVSHPARVRGLGRRVVQKMAATVAARVCWSTKEALPACKGGEPPCGAVELEMMLDRRGIGICSQEGLPGGTFGR